MQTGQCLGSLLAETPLAAIAAAIALTLTALALLGILVRRLLRGNQGDEDEGQWDK